MLADTYNIILIFAFVSFLGSAVISILENLSRRDGLEAGFRNAFKIILMGFSALFFLVLALMGGEITTINSSCVECSVAADPYSIFLYGFLSFFSMVMLMLFFLGNLWESRG